MSKKFALIPLIAAACAIAAPEAQARKDIQTWPLASFLANDEYMARLEGFRFGWGDTITGTRLLSTSTRKATNGLTKSDEFACQWALLSALLALKKEAEAHGGTGVEGLKSLVSGETFSSTTEFQCISGFTNSRVYLEGVIVK